MPVPAELNPMRACFRPVILVLGLSLITLSGVRADDLASRLMDAGVTSTKKARFHDFAELDFDLPGQKDVECKIVSPKTPAPGHPWVWRARFWDHEPDFDIALLTHGYHLVYCS